MFRMTMLPAEDGDCLLLDYGTEAQQHHVLIDGGRASAYDAVRPALKAIAERGECIDLLILSHIDSDHIEGFLPLAKPPEPPVKINQVWYNGFDQLSGLELYGAEQGDEFSAALRDRKWPWNVSFGGGPVVLPDDKPIDIEGPGGLKITLLTPTKRALERLRNEWITYRREHDLPIEELPLPAGLELFGAELEVTAENVPALADMQTSVDRTVPNASSIAFIAEFDGRRVLLGADANPSDLIAALKHWNADAPKEIHLAKIPHHGSKANNTIPLVRAMGSKRFAVSTSGARNEHPHPQAIARLIHYGGQDIDLYFNYRSAFTSVWDTDEMNRAFNHRCHFPPAAAGLITVEI